MPKIQKNNHHLHTPGKRSTGAVLIGTAYVPRSRHFKIPKLEQEYLPPPKPKLMMCMCGFLKFKYVQIIFGILTPEE